MKNISGIFEIELNEKTYEAKCNFGVVERLERRILNRSIFEALNDAVNGRIFLTDITDTIHTALLAGGNKNFKRDDVGEAVHSGGMENYVEWYIKFLTYALTGKTEPDLEEDKETDKKK